MRILHIITGLSTGGAEMMLYKLLSRLDRDAFEPGVISLMDMGTLGNEIQALGIPVYPLGMRRGIPDPLKLLRLVRLIRTARPHIIQTWMHHADLLGGLAAKLAGNSPIIWGIRSSTFDQATSRRTTVLIAKISALLSPKLPACIVSCSEIARQVHVAMGYADDKMVVIPNGFDLELFKPDPEARWGLRQEEGIGAEDIVIGLIGRFHPQKDHRNFIQAAGLVSEKIPQVRFLLCGEGIDWDNRELVSWIQAAGIQERCILLGRRSDMPRINAALDLVSLASAYGEAFPNVIGEAMACGVPCVVTDVGDSAYIVGDTGIVVPPKDPQALTKGWQRLLSMDDSDYRQLGERARKRIEIKFSIKSITQMYSRLYWELSDNHVND